MKAKPATDAVDSGMEERRKLAHYFPSALRGDPLPWTSLCGKLTLTDRTPDNRKTQGVPRCVVCLNLKGHSL